VNVQSGTDPVRWWQIDSWCHPVRMDQLPAADAMCWEAHYANDCEKGKRTSRKLQPPWERVMTMMEDVESVEEWSRSLGYPVETDRTHHGGGLHVTEPGGWLNVHLDYDLHPLIPGRRRAINLIAFLNPTWEPHWGGALILTDPLGHVRKRVYPAPGRLFAFEVGDLSYHGVEPITGHEERVTCACYFLAAATGQETRKRALFMPRREKSIPPGQQDFGRTPQAPRSPILPAELGEEKSSGAA
jgi:hypothetical protein